MAQTSCCPEVAGEPAFDDEGWEGERESRIERSKRGSAWRRLGFGAGMRGGDPKKGREGGECERQLVAVGARGSCEKGGESESESSDARSPLRPRQ